MDFLYLFRIFGASALDQSIPSIFSTLVPSSKRTLILVLLLLGFICQLVPRESLIRILRLCTQLSDSERGCMREEQTGPSWVPEVWIQAKTCMHIDQPFVLRCPPVATLLRVFSRLLRTLFVLWPCALGALGRRFESCRPDQSETGFPACLFLWLLVV